MRALHIQMRQSDMHAANSEKEASCFTCPVAHALNRVTGGNPKKEETRWGVSGVAAYSKPFGRLELPPDMILWIRRWEKGDPKLKPASFTLYVEEPVEMCSRLDREFQESLRELQVA